MIIGLTGTYCAGKNHIAAIMEKRDYPVLDVDKLGYQVLESEKEAIYSKFGTDLRKINSSWQPENPLDRRLLGQVVFRNPDKLAILEAIIHPVVNRQTDEWVAAQTGHCVINAALLHRSSIFRKLNCIILITAPFFTRLLRAKHRDKLPWRELFRRFTSQKDFYAQYLSINAEIYRVGNPGLYQTGSRNIKLERQIDRIIERIG
ncbi:MAG: dephospho-CoA kinase [Treponema sp.]|nr:dephospho-CoA kinase [Treponema sp.]